MVRQRKSKVNRYGKLTRNQGKGLQARYNALCGPVTVTRPGEEPGSGVPEQPGGDVSR